MTEADKPKSPREIWSDMIKESYILNSDEREMMLALDDNLIELALRSRDSMSFLHILPQIDPDLKGLKLNKDVPEKYRLIMQLLNKRKKEQKIRKQRQ